MVRISSLLFCLLCFAAAVHAQEEEPPIEVTPPPPVVFDGEDDDDWNYFDSDTNYTQRFLFDAGITNVRPWKVNDALFGTGGFYQLNTVGITENYSEEANEGVDDTYLGNDVSFSLHWFLAHEIQTIRPDGDQMKYRLKGWELMTSTLGVNFIKNEHVDFVTGIGMYWGNLKLDATNITENSEARRYKNPFVAPMLRAELRFNVWLLSFGGRWSYRHDITRDNWKRKDEGLDPLPGYQFREMQFMVYLGFRINDSY